ncbi:hypothetical protein OX283_014220 [Flavobacterium sp. SUN052]|uniref:hypothetical protein n=1 Tax=Flavobacterium sp. SUN052 TaxID=3002441 RepID=UPI00237E5137|nr:hypothetical protein [Flavobacterium sp. SUN052]MEC4005823.1 hypothetical protein [Flavobacterium sp. SUN052]
MKTLKLILIIFLITINYTAFACDCDSQGEFLKVAPKTKLVALVKITKYLTFRDIYEEKTPMSMEVEIIEMYKGAEKRKSITVWGDFGNLCRPYLSIFEVGKFYVIAFDAGIDGSKGFAHKNEKITDFSISVCGDYWLDVDIKKKIAKGSVTEKQTQISLKDLRTKLKTN